MLSRREHWLHAMAALGSQPTWEWTAVVIQKNSDNILEDFIQRKLRRKWRKNKLNQNNNFRAKRMLCVWEMFNIPCNMIQNGKDHNVHDMAQWYNERVQNELANAIALLCINAHRKEGLSAIYGCLTNAIFKEMFLRIYISAHKSSAMHLSFSCALNTSQRIVFWFQASQKNIVEAGSCQ